MTRPEVRVTPERALEHDARCERELLVYSCKCDLRSALAASRQREEEAKGEIARLGCARHRVAQKSPGGCCVIGHVVTFWDEKFCEVADEAEKVAGERDALKAENARLTLAASESARTLQVENTKLQELINEKLPLYVQEIAKLKNQVTALREALMSVMWVESKVFSDHWICAVCSVWKDKDAHHSVACIIGNALAALPQHGQQLICQGCGKPREMVNQPLCDSCRSPQDGA